MPESSSPRSSRAQNNSSGSRSRATGGSRSAGGVRGVESRAVDGRDGRSQDRDRFPRQGGRSFAREEEKPLPRKKGWGSVARKGAATVQYEGPVRSSEAEADRRERPRPAPSEWEYARTDKPTARKKQSGSKQASVEVEPLRLSPDAIKEIEERIGKKSDKYVRYLRDAARAYSRERWGDVRKALRPLLAEIPDAPSVQELNGMVLYRTGKWAAAAKELEASNAQTMSFDLYPAIMDCRRALKQNKKVEALWEELRQMSPDAEVMAEGRIVYAAFLADQDRLQDAIRLLEKLPKPRNAKEYHLRTWYVLADLYERAGDAGNARLWFERVAQHDPDLADVLDRLELLD